MEKRTEYFKDANLLHMFKCIENPKRSFLELEIMKKEFCENKLIVNTAKIFIQYVKINNQRTLIVIFGN